MIWSKQAKTPRHPFSTYMIRRSKLEMPKLPSQSQEVAVPYSAFTVVTPMQLETVACISLSVQDVIPAGTPPSVTLIASSVPSGGSSPNPFPETDKVLGDHGIQLVSLTTWHDVLQEARRRSSFDTATLDEVGRFLDAPRAWQDARTATP